MDFLGKVVLRRISTLFETDSSMDFFGKGGFETDFYHLFERIRSVLLPSICSNRKQVLVVNTL